MDKKKVVIIGAGCAGLSAAYTLKKAGIDFILLEATDRVGGRVRTVDRDGYSYSVGALMTEPQWKTTFQYLKELGLTDKVLKVKTAVFAFWNRGRIHYLKVGKGMNPFKLLAFRGLPYGVGLQALEFLASTRKYSKYIPKGSYNFTRLLRISRFNAAHYGTKHGGRKFVDHILSPLLSILILARPQEVSCAHPIALLSITKGICGLQGGLSVLTDALYAQVRDSVWLSTPVDKVVIQEGRVKGVETAEGFIEADQVICCTDAVIARQIIPDLPAAMRRPLETCTYSTTYNYSFGLEKRIVPDDFLALMIPASKKRIINVVYDENAGAFGQRGPQGIGLMRASTCGWHDQKLMALSDEERRQKVIREMQKYFPEFPDEPMWTDCTRYDRAFNSEAPGQFKAIQELLESHMRDVKGLYLAGEYLFLIACTEGAYFTGRKAAQVAIADQ